MRPDTFIQTQSDIVRAGYEHKVITTVARVTTSFMNCADAVAYMRELAIQEIGFTYSFE